MIFWVSFFVFFFFLIFELVTFWIFVRRSKQHYHELWVHAGKPALGFSDATKDWHLTSYLLHRSYSEIQDEKSNIFAEKFRLPFIFSYLGARFTIALFLVAMFLDKLL